MHFVSESFWFGSKAGNTQARLLISKDGHMERYFQYADLAKNALSHFRRFLRAKPKPYSSDGECTGKCLPSSIIWYDGPHQPSPCRPDDRIKVQVIHSPEEWISFPNWPPENIPNEAHLSSDGEPQFSALFIFTLNAKVRDQVFYVLP